MDSLYLVMPAYNEEENIEDVVRAWYPVLEGKGEASRMAVADSGSTDGTHVILETLRREMPQLEILPDTGKEHGPKVIALYDYAIKNGADYIFQTDSDGQTDPAEFARFWNLRERYAGIFGLRKDRGDGKIRAFVERVVCLLLGLYFHVSIPDANAPFRLMRADVVKKYLYRMDPDYNLPNVMITAFFAYYHEKMRFRKITFRPRQAGANSVNLPKIFKIGWKALGDFRAFKKEMRREEDAERKLPETYPGLLDDFSDEPQSSGVAETVTDAPESVTETESPDVAETVADAPESVTETQSSGVAETSPDAEAVRPETPDAESVSLEKVSLEKPDAKES